MAEYLPPAGNALVFNATSDTYLPPAGDALLFGAAAAEALELAAVCTLGVAVSARLGTGRALAARAGLPLHWQIDAATALALPVAAVAALPLTTRATAQLGTRLAARAELPISARAETAPSWYIPVPFGGQTRARWHDGRRQEHRSRHPHRQAATLEPVTRAPWGEQVRLQPHLGGPWRAIPERQGQVAAPWRPLQARPQNQAGLPYAHPARRQREALHLPWGDPEALAATVAAGYAHPDRNSRHLRLPWDGFADRFDAQLTLAHSHPAVKDVFKPIVSGPYWYPRWCLWHYPLPDGGHLIFDFPAAGYVAPAGAALIFDAGQEPGRIYTCFDGTWNGPKDAYWYRPRPWHILQPNIRRVYFVQNTVSLTRLADGVPIPVETLNIACDRDSWAWTLNATLVRKTDLDLVRPAGGAPVEVEAAVNGLLWRFVIEEYGEEARFGQRAYTAVGRSLSAYLAAPYSAPGERLQTQHRTAQQLAEEELTDTGFTLVWGLPSWLVPGGVWSYANQTPIQAIAQIAAAAGGTVQSHPRLTQLLVQPWYSAPPWNWGAVAVGAIIPDSLIDSRRGRYEPRTAYTGVYCRGQQQGVTCFVRRAGSDGSRLAPQQVHSLITATEPGLAQGRHILADSGPRSLETLALPLLDNPGLLAPGALVAVQGAENWRGQVIRTHIAAQRPAVWQTLDVLRYHGS